MPFSLTFCSCNVFTYSIIAAMAVLKRNSSISCVTFFIVWFIFLFMVSLEIRNCKLEISQTSAHTRLTKRFIPSTPVKLQGFEASNGPINISYMRKVSAPCFGITSSGVTTFPQRLLIFRESGPKIQPGARNFKKGSSPKALSINP